MVTDVQLNRFALLKTNTGSEWSNCVNLVSHVGSIKAQTCNESWTQERNQKLVELCEWRLLVCVNLMQSLSVCLAGTFVCLHLQIKSVRMDAHHSTSAITIFLLSKKTGMTADRTAKTEEQIWLL